MDSADSSDIELPIIPFNPSPTKETKKNFRVDKKKKHNNDVD